MNRLARFLQPLGVEPAQFTLVVHTKMLLAQRDAGLGLSRLANKPSAHPLRNNLLVNLVLGGFLALLLFIPLPLAYKDTAYFASLMLIVFMTMLTGYSALMLDPKDRAVFATRGVNAQTLNAARIAVVGYYLLLNAASLGALALVPTFLQHGVVAALLFAVAVLLLAVFCLVLALLGYLLVLRFFDGERLKNLLNFLQIAMIVGAYVASQVLPRLGENAVFTTHAVRLSWPWLLTPPAWFAGLAMLPTQGGPLIWGAAALGVAVTGGGVLFYLAHAARFEQYLAKLDLANGATGRVGWYYRLCRRVLVRNGQNAGYFTLGWQLLRQEREFKLRVYPQFAYALVVPVVFAFNFADGNGLNGVLPFLPYVAASLVMAIPVAAINLRFAEQPAAMRVFQYVPFEAHGALILGVVQAMYCRLVLPLTLGLGVLGLAAGWQGLLALPAMVVGLYAATLLFGRGLAGTALPFAQPFDPKRNAMASATMIPIIAGMPVGLGIIFVGGLLHAWWFAVLVLAVGAFVAWQAQRGFAAIYLRLHA